MATKCVAAKLKKHFRPDEHCRIHKPPTFSEKRESFHFLSNNDMSFLSTSVENGAKVVIASVQGERFEHQDCVKFQAPCFLRDDAQSTQEQIQPLRSSEFGCKFFSESISDKEMNSHTNPKRMRTWGGFQKRFFSCSILQSLPKVMDKNFAKRQKVRCQQIMGKCLSPERGSRSGSAAPRSFCKIQQRRGSRCGSGFCVLVLGSTVLEKWPFVACQVMHLLSVFDFTQMKRDRNWRSI